MSDRKLRILVAKPGLDGHDRGAKDPPPEGAIEMPVARPGADGGGKAEDCAP